MLSERAFPFQKAFPIFSQIIPMLAPLQFSTETFFPSTVIKLHPQDSQSTHQPDYSSEKYSKTPHRARFYTYFLSKIISEDRNSFKKLLKSPPKSRQFCSKINKRTRSQKQLQSDWQITKKKKLFSLLINTANSRINRCSNTTEEYWIQQKEVWP